MGNKFKIILHTGRELGPLGEEEIKKLIKKNIIKGDERARLYPDGSWKAADQMSELAPIFISILQEKLGSPSSEEIVPNNHKPSEVKNIEGTTVVLVPEVAEIKPVEKKKKKKKKKTQKEEISKTEIVKKNATKEQKELFDKKNKQVFFNEEDQTEFATFINTKGSEDKGKKLALISSHKSTANIPQIFETEKTVLFSNEELRKIAPVKSEEETKPPSGIGAWIRITIIGLALGYLLSQVFDEHEKKPEKTNLTTITAQMPTFLDSAAQPDASEKMYAAAMKNYYFDNVKHYKSAVKKLHLAIALDKDNVRALSMLASTYLNLVDASNKKDNYFNVVKDLIEMARAKNLDLLETVIADIEFYITVDQLKAAEARIVDFTRGKESHPPELYYYLSYVYFLSENYEESKRFLSRFDGDGEFFFGPRVLYLKGQVFEKLGNIQEAEVLYKKNLKKFPEHAKTIIALVDILRRQGKEIEGAHMVDLLLKNREYLTKKDTAHVLYLHGIIKKNAGDLKRALTSIQVAVRLEPENSEYVLEYFNLRAKLGDSNPRLRSMAKMFYLLSEGEKLYQAGSYDEALQSFLRASFEDKTSALPHVKLGDVFYRKKQLRNARESYKKAVRLSSKNIHYWSKYIQVLLDSYEWDQINKSLRILYSVPSQKSASLVRRIRGEILARQGRHTEALDNYRRSMSYEEVDTEVYIAYAQSLLALKEYEQARFFFSLGKRFDPFNMSAIFGTAQAISMDRSIDEAIKYLEEEFKRLGGKNADILSKIAEYKIQKGDIYGAKISLDKAKKVAPDSAAPYKVEGDMEYQNKNDKKALERALFAFKFYSDRNPSDPSGYIKRFEIFMQTGNYSAARTELDLVYKDYPKYPGLHYLYGQLYSALGNKEEALSEYRQEIQNHPGASESMLQLGILLLESGEPREALGLFIQADQVRGGLWAEAKSWAGFANFHMKNYEGAVALYLSAIQIDGGNPIHYKRIGQAQWSQGDKVNARQSFSKYLQLAPDAPDRGEIQPYLQ